MSASKNGKTSVCIMFPNNSTSVQLANNVMSDMANIAFFIPEGVHEQAAFTAYEEVRLNSIGIDIMVEKVNDYEAVVAYDYVIFPLLDVNPRKSRQAYGSMCRNLFK